MHRFAPRPAARLLQSGLLLSMLLGWPAASPAGWVVTEGQGEDRAITYIQSNRIRYEDSEQVTIFDLDKGAMCILQPASKRYWSGTPQEFSQQMKAAVEFQLEAELQGVSPEDRQALKEAVSPPPPFQPPQGLEVRVETTGQVDRVAGQAARKHRILVEGRLVEEVWIAEDLDLRRDLDPEKFANLIAQAKSDEVGDWEYDPQVRALRAKGLEMKSVRFGVAGPEEIGVVLKVEQKELPASVFEVPAGYEKASMAQILE